MESPCLICTPIQDSMLDTRKKSERVKSTEAAAVLLLAPASAAICFFLFFLLDRNERLEDEDDVDTVERDAIG